MDKLEDIFKILKAGIEDASSEAQNTMVMATHAGIMALHIKAISCHCECLGMNAENALAVCGNYTPPYNDAAYYQVMQKWGLADEKGEPLI